MGGMDRSNFNFEGVKKISMDKQEELIDRLRDARDDMVSYSTTLGSNWRPRPHHIRAITDALVYLVENTPERPRASSEPTGFTACNCQYMHQGPCDTRKHPQPEYPNVADC